MEYEAIVSSDVRKNRMDSLKAFADARMMKHFDYFQNNQVVSTALLFLKKVIDNFA